MPHVTDIVSPKDAEGIERILSSMDALIDAREDSFRRLKIDLDGFRERRFAPGSDGLGGTDANDPFGDVFVVVDDYDDLYSKDTVLGDRIISLSSRGPEYGCTSCAAPAAGFTGNGKACCKTPRRESNCAWQIRAKARWGTRRSSRATRPAGH